MKSSITFSIIAAVMFTCVSVSTAKTVKPTKHRFTPALCEMLGMADEYISRFDYHTNKPVPLLAEHFYPGEKVLADHYIKLVAAYKKQSGLRFAAKLVTDNHGHYQVRSKRLSQIINSFYRPGGGVDKGSTIASLERRRILKASKACRVRYLKGAYRRYHRNSTNVIAMANASLKIETIGYVLKSLGSPSVAVLSRQTIPTGNNVFFSVTPALKSALSVKKRVTLTQFSKEPNAVGLKKL